MGRCWRINVPFPVSVPRPVPVPSLPPQILGVFSDILVRICAGRTCIFFALKWFPSILGDDFYRRKECGDLFCIPVFVSPAQDNDYS